MANDRFQAWWPLKDSKTWRPMEGEKETSLIRDQWKNILAWWLMKKHFYLVVNGKRRNIFFTSFHFSIQKIFLEPYSH
jgi:hypothetical protein